MGEYLSTVESLRDQFSSTVLKTQISWLLLIVISIAITAYHRKNMNLKKPLAVLILIGGLYNFYTILMKWKANMLLNSFEPSFRSSQALGQGFVDEAIDLIWINGIIRTIILAVMSLAVVYIVKLRYKKNLLPTHWTYGLVLGLFINSILISLLKFDFETVFNLFKLK